MSNPNDPGPRLAAWRAARKDLDPKATLQSCADAVGVKHPTWLDWENGNRSPGLEKALAIELFTDGALEIEAWDFDVKVFETIRSVIARRDATTGAVPASPPDPVAPPPAAPKPAPNPYHTSDPADPAPPGGTPEWSAWSEREQARQSAVYDPDEDVYGDLDDPRPSQAA
jgi:transcriptional regulator with XRE-family HTH domain